MGKLIPWVTNSDLKLRGSVLISPYTTNTCLTTYATPGLEESKRENSAILGLLRSE